MAELTLEGIRIVAFSWLIAAPMATRLLADMGAEVIKIESHKKIDGVRIYGPWRDGVATPPDGSGWFAKYNRNKMSIALDLTTHRGVDICKELIRISDVAINNFSAGAMKKFGLEYQVLQKVNPKIIIVNMPGFGQSGPYSEYSSYGPLIESLSGINYLSGYPDCPPCGFGTPYADYVGALHAAVAILAALESRRKTGEGQYIDLSQHEAAVSVMGTEILDYTVNHHVQESLGNRHPAAAPHGCYRCKGEDRWCAIAVFNDIEWQAFCSAIGNPTWAEDARFATVLGRVEYSDELDRLVETWTIKYSAEEVMHKLQRVGVAAGVVQNIEDLMTRDPQLKARRFYEEVDVPFKFSRTFAGIRTPPPLLGQHTRYVLGELLGMSTAAIEQLTADGVLE